MKRLIVFIWFAALATAAGAQENFRLRTGDLLFQVGRSGSFNEAIMAATGSEGGINYTHVGVVKVEDAGVYVLEATMPFVAKTPLKDFLSRSAQADGKPVVSVARLNPLYYGSIKGAVRKIESLIGKPYDYVFDPHNDAYYCTEIIYLSFIAWDGSRVFESRPMTFRDKETGKTVPMWAEHFERHKTAIPEGVFGTNPADMSRSKAIKVIYHYFR